MVMIVGFRISNWVSGFEVGFRVFSLGLSVERLGIGDQGLGFQV